MTWVPPSWAHILVGTPIAGSVDSINAVGSFVADVSLDAWQYKGFVEGAKFQMSSLQAVAIDKISAKVDSALVPGAYALKESADSAKRAFDTYASEVDRIHNDAKKLRTDVDDSLNSIGAQAAEIARIAVEIRRSYSASLYAWDVGAPGQMPEPILGTVPDDFTQAQRSAAIQNLRNLYENQWQRAATIWHNDIEEIKTAKTKWSTLIEDRRRAEGQLVLALENTPVGQLITLASGAGTSRKSAIAYAFSGELWGDTSGALSMATSHPLLKKLIGSENGGDIWNSPPNPELVAENWWNLTSAEQKKLINEVPWVIGNLPGLPYAARDEANRLSLAYYAVNREWLGGDMRTAADELMKIVAAGNTTLPPVQVVAFNLRGAVPLVAVGYGDLDTADNITWQVPGMESDAHNALGVWDEASRNLYREQSYLSALNGSGSVGVVSFLSYDTPNLSDSIGWWSGSVLSPDLAQAGAPRLAAELDGNWATRNVLNPDALTTHVDPPRIAVNAHSYGTTTATNALSMVTHAVDSFSMAGSAGLDTKTVTSFDDIKVAEVLPGQKAIYASHADGDGLAGVGLVLGDRANPNINFQYEHRTNFEGSIYYSSEGATTPGGVEFAPTDGHSVIGPKDTQWYDIGTHIKQMPGFESSEGQGYWDRGTQSLRNLAATSLGLHDEVIGGLYVAAE